ncbi:MAG TPA: hemolysin family protein [Thermodesulfobacteriota bacterium]|nr:hemolysin family protein [Thermodesulfobacteriota bacterium]
MDSLIPILIIILLVLLNGFFVAAEFAIVGVSRAAIEHRAAEGHRIAQLIRYILHDPRQQDMYIATAQLGITVASLGLGMYGEHVLAEWVGGWLGTVGTPNWIAAHAVASVLSVAILTYLHIVLGEMVPKSLALQQAERTVFWITPPMRWIMIALYPFVVSLNGLGNGILKLVGIDRQTVGGQHYHTPEELEFIVEESLERGLLHTESGQVLRELFKFEDLTAGEVMTPRVKVTGIPVGATSSELIEIVRASPHTRYPVYDGDLDHIIGMIHIKDILRRLIDKKPIQARDARKVPYVPETTELDRVLEIMHQGRTHMVVVMDEHGGSAGIITIEDLFEEVIGAIEEETHRRPEMYQDEKGKLHAAGTVRVEEVGEYLDIPLEHEEVDTVSGLILAILGRPPVVGDTVTYDGVKFEVTAVEGHGVKECIIIPINREEA